MSSSSRGGPHPASQARLGLPNIDVWGCHGLERLKADGAIEKPEIPAESLEAIAEATELLLSDGLGQYAERSSHPSRFIGEARRRMRVISRAGFSTPGQSLRPGKVFCLCRLTVASKLWPARGAGVTWSKLFCRKSDPIRPLLILAAKRPTKTASRLCAAAA